MYLNFGTKGRRSKGAVPPASLTPVAQTTGTSLRMGLIIMTATATRAIAVVPMIIPRIRFRREAGPSWPWLSAWFLAIITTARAIRATPTS